MIRAAQIFHNGEVVNTVMVDDSNIPPHLLKLGELVFIDEPERTENVAD